MANALKTANSARPGSLKTPVPGKTAQTSADDFLASFDAPEMAAPSAESPTSADSFVDSVGADPLMENARDLSGDTANVSADQFAPEPSFAQANADQLQNFTTRIQTGLAANDTEKLGFLQNKFGKENAVVKGGNIYFRRNKDEKLKRLDPDTLELINDIIPDFAREIVTEAAMLPGEVAGSFAAGPGGAIAGRAATAPFANMAADKVAEFAGVPQDETRSKLIENTLSSGSELLLPIVGKQIIKRIPGTQAYLNAKKAGEKELVALTKQNQEVLQAATEMESIGRAATIDGQSIGIPGANVSLMGHHISPETPHFKQIADFAASNPKFINAQNQLAEGWGDSARNVLQEIAQRNSKGPVAPERLGETIINAVDSVKQAEGKAIGNYRTKAMAKLKNGRQALPPEVDSHIEILMGDLGFTRKTRTTEVFNKTSGSYNKVNQTVLIPPKDMRPLVGKLGLTSEGEIRSVVNALGELNKMNDPISNVAAQRGVRLTDLERARNTIGALSDRLRGTQAGGELGKLSGGLRTHYRDVIASGLDSVDEKQTFNAVMDDYSELMGNVTQLKAVLKDNASAKAVVSSVFTGKENLNKVKALKSIAPEEFPALKEEWINQMLTEYSSRSSSTGLKSGAFLDSLDKKYGKQFVKEVLDDGPGANSETLRKILTVTERLESQMKGVKVDQLSDQRKQGIMNTVIGLAANIKFKSINGITGILRGSKNKDSALLEIMSRDGIDRYIAKYPGKIDSAAVRKNLSDMLAQHKLFKQIEGAALSDPSKRTSRRLLIDNVIKPGQEFSEEQNIGIEGE
jgi:hypothetical protein